MKNKTNLILTVVKVLVSAGLIYWLLSNSDFDAIMDSIRQASPVVLVIAFSLYMVGYLITSLRWRTLLKAQGIQAPLLYLIQSFAVAVFFNNFMPTTIGGDVVRMYDSWRIGGSKSKAVSTVMIDRFFGMFSLMIYALGAVLLAPAIAGRIPALRLWIVLGLGATLLSVYILFFRTQVLESLSRLLGRVLRPLGRLVDKLYQAVNAFHGRRDVLLKTLGLSLLLHLNVIMHFVLIARALDIEVPVVAMFVIIPVALVAMMVPVTINAIGVREAVFVFLFGIYLVPREQSIAFAWVAFGFLLLQGVIGGIVFALRRRTQRQNPGNLTKPPE